MKKKKKKKNLQAQAPFCYFFSLGASNITSVIVVASGLGQICRILNTRLKDVAPDLHLMLIASRLSLQIKKMKILSFVLTGGGFLNTNLDTPADT